MKTIRKIHSTNRLPFFFTPLALLWCLVMMMFPTAVRGANTFADTASLATARYDHTATLLPNGKVLVAGGYGPGGILASVELYDPAAGTWTAAGSLATARSSHTASLLPNGKVLFAGGEGPGGILASAELYDPATGTWAITSSLATARRSHTATLLPNGKLLVAGGDDASNSLGSSELYDPATGTWSATGSLAIARSSHSATLLPGGGVLVAGGDNGPSSLASTELYNPGAGTWSAGGSLSIPRSSHTSTLLPNGKLLIAAGYFNNNAIASADIYDPVAGIWTTTTLATARYGHTSTLLPNGKVLIAGGGDINGRIASAELYDPTTGALTNTGPLSTARQGHTATMLSNGEALVTGGYGPSGILASAELYNSATGAWAVAGSLATARYDYTATLLPNGKVLAAGGGDNNSGRLASVELYDPATETWTATGSLATARRGFTATLLPNGKVLAAGGDGPSGTLASAELYDPQTGVWSGTGPLATARYDHTATLLPNGKVLVAGGRGSGTLASAELYDPATGTWSATGSLAAARYDFTATLLPNGKVLAAGGGDNFGYLGSAELYDPTSGIWAATGSLATARFDHTATLLPSGKVLVAAGQGDGVLLANAELYDPSTGTWAATGSLVSTRRGFTAMLLPNGKVLVAGGYGPGITTSMELFNPATGTWTGSNTIVGSLSDHTATLLPNGKALVAGGYTYTGVSSTYLYEAGQGFAAGWQPQISSASFNAAGRLVLVGTGLRGISSASGGNGSQDSPSNHPVVQLRSLNHGQGGFLLSDPATSVSDTTFTSMPVNPLPSGHTLVTVFSNGIPSVSFVVSPPLVPLVSLVASPGSTVEGGTCVFSVQLSMVSGLPVTVNYATADATAVAPGDYTSASGQLTIPAGTTSALIVIQTAHDTLYEANETFTVTISSPFNSTLDVAASATCVIIDNDPPPLVSLVASPDPTMEGSASVFSVQLSMVSGLPVTVDYATADDTAVAPGDYTATSGQLTIPAGQTSGQIVIQTASDTLYEANETFTVTISNPVNSTLNGSASAYGAIFNDDPLPLVSLVASPDPTMEGSASVFSFQLSIVSGLPVTVNYATADATAVAPGDYTSASGQLTIPAGQTSGQIVIQTGSDTHYETNETFTVTISNPVNSTLDVAASATCVIIDNDPPPLVSLVASPGSTVEGDVCVFSVQLSMVSGLPVTVNYATADGAAMAPGDYTAASGQLTIPAGQTSGQIVIQTASDTLYEANETFTVTISNPVNSTLNGSASAYGAIFDDDPPPLVSLSPGTTWEGSLVYFKVQLSTVSGLPVTVDYATADGTAVAPGDYTATSGQFTIPAGQTSGQFVIQTATDIHYETDESFTVTISNPINSTLLDRYESANGLIIEVDPLRLSYAYVPGDGVGWEGGGCYFRFQLSKVSNLPVTVDYATADGTAVAPGDYTATSGQLTIPAGQTSGGFFIQTAEDTHYEKDEYFRVRISNPVNCRLDKSASAPYDVIDVPYALIIDDDPPPLVSLVASPGSTIEGGTCFFTVQLSTVSTLPVTVNYATADGAAVAPGDYTTVSSQLTIPAGATSALIVIQTAHDTLYEADETFTVTISNPVNSTLDVASATGVINNNDPPPLGLANVVVEAGDGTTPPSVSGTVTGGPPFGLVVAEVSSDLGGDDPWKSFAVLGTDGEGSATFVRLLAPAERLGARRLFFRFRSP